MRQGSCTSLARSFPSASACCGCGTDSFGVVSSSPASKTPSPLTTVYAHSAGILWRVCRCETPARPARSAGVRPQSLALLTQRRRRARRRRTGSVVMRLFKKVYRTFPELDRFTDEQCRGFERAARREQWTSGLFMNAIGLGLAAMWTAFGVWQFLIVLNVVSGAS